MPVAPMPTIPESEIPPENEEDLTCRICSKRYKSKAGVKQHMTRIHHEVCLYFGTLWNCKGKFILVAPVVLNTRKTRHNCFTCFTWLFCCYFCGRCKTFNSLILGIFVDPNFGACGANFFNRLWEDFTIFFVIATPVPISYPYSRKYISIYVFCYSYGKYIRSWAKFFYDFLWFYSPKLCFS